MECKSMLFTKWANLPPIGGLEPDGEAEEWRSCFSLYYPFPVQVGPLTVTSQEGQWPREQKQIVKQVEYTEQESFDSAI